MADPHGFLAAPESTREELMRATYLALCEYGYAGLTVERIGEEFPKSKSLIYHHHEDKDDLLLSFLQFMLERFEEEMPFEEPVGPAEQLQLVIDHIFTTPLPAERAQYISAMIELRAQAAHDEAYREQFSRHDRFFTERLADLIEEGIEEGVFRDIDPESAAAMLLATFNGSMGARVTTTDETADTIRTEVEHYVRERLLREGTT